MHQPDPDGFKARHAQEITMSLWNKAARIRIGIDRLVEENLRKLGEMPWLYQVKDEWNLQFDKISITQDLGPIETFLGMEAKPASKLSLWAECLRTTSEGTLLTWSLKKIPPSENGRCWATQIVRTINLSVNAIGHVVEHTAHLPNNYTVFRGKRYFEEAFNKKILTIAHRNEALNGFEKSHFIPH